MGDRHQVGSAVSRAYQRSTMLELRREMIAMWGYLAGNVVPLVKRA
jgi:hypothetical protein